MGKCLPSLQRHETIQILRMLLSLAACVPAWKASADTSSQCIRDPDIVSETRPDDYTILFALRDHSVWKNTLQSRCFGLHNEPDGFTYQPTDPATQELCSNQVTIKLNSFRSTCLLGAFKRLK